MQKCCIRIVGVRQAALLWHMTCDDDVIVDVF